MTIRLALIVPLAAIALSPCEARNTETGALNARTCMSVEDCVAALQTETSANGGQDYTERFEKFGAAAAGPLMNLIINGDDRISALAAQAATSLPSIEAPYLPALIARDRKGNPRAFNKQGRGWLAHVIGRVGTDEALEYLFETMSDLPERAGINDGVGPAIQRFGPERYLAQVRRRLEQFPKDGDAVYLSNLVDLANGPLPLLPEPMPEWVEPALARIATAPSNNKDARAVATFHLQAFKNPIALSAVLRDAKALFATLPPPAVASHFILRKGSDGSVEWERQVDREYEHAIRDLSAFGAIAREGGPLLLMFLGRRDLPDSRAQAALGLGEMGYVEAIPFLIAALEDRDDWLLVYNASEALGKLKATKARGALEHLTRQHWSGAVRSSAARALRALDFPSVGQAAARDHPVDEVGDEEEVYFGPLRFRGDGKTDNPECLQNVSREQPLSQAPVGKIGFSTDGASETVRRPLVVSDLPSIPSSVRRQLPGGHATVIEPLEHGHLVGTDDGEFIGGLAYMPADHSAPSLVVPDNISLSFRLGDKFYVLTGLSHLISSYGEIWEIDEKAPVPQVVRRIRLPSEARHVIATSTRKLAFVTDEGTVLLDVEGNLLFPDAVESCAAATDEKEAGRRVSP